MAYLSFTPIYQARVWGGHNLQKYLDRDLPQGMPIGESWDIVDRHEAQSIIRNGPWKGMSLRKAIEFYGEDILGPHWPTNRSFPLIVKWLDCQERLSLQVHPPKNLAHELQGEPKCENWYIAQATPKASLIAGLKKGITEKVLRQSIIDNTVSECVHTIPVKKGDSLFVPSGRVHAIDAGALILEIQENSDTTYRIYDWGRLGLDGKPRELHVEKALKSIQFADYEPQPIAHQAGNQLLVDCSVFRIRKVDLDVGLAPLQFSIGQEATLITIVSGQLRLVGTSNQNPSDLKAGNTLLLPYSQHFSFEATEPSTVLITDRFTR